MQTAFQLWTHTTVGTVSHALCSIRQQAVRSGSVRLAMLPVAL